MQQTPGSDPGYWSPDRHWWWDGRQWIPASQAPFPPPPPYWPPYSSPFTFPGPSPGLRVFLIVVLIINSVIWGLLSVFGMLGTLQNATELGSYNSAQRGDFYGGLILFGVIAALFAISLLATVGVLMRTSWARWAAIAAGIASCLTCLGSVVGIPILVSAARAPIAKNPNA